MLLCVFMCVRVCMCVFMCVCMCVCVSVHVPNASPVMQRSEDKLHDSLYFFYHMGSGD